MVRPEPKLVQVVGRNDNSLPCVSSRQYYHITLSRGPKYLPITR